MSLIQSAKESLKTSNRRILVMGPRGTGKTTFAVSASAKAGDTLTGEVRDCDDVLVIQGDTEGIMGAVDAGLHPGMVLEMTDCDTWPAYQARLINGLKELADKLTDGTIKVIVIDLAHPAQLIVSHVAPTQISDWQAVKAEGAKLFRAFSRYRGVTVVGICQVTSAMVLGEGSSKGAQAGAIDAATALAIGGERSTFKEDLVKGVATPWLDHTSFIFTRDSKRKRSDDGKGFRKEFFTLTQSTMKFAAKSRAESVLPQLLPGERSLRSILNQVYGESV